MDDREIAKIMRKRDLAYVKHLNETSPHTQSHDKLEGGFLSAIAAAAKIAAKMAIRAAKAAAKATAKAASKAAKAAKKAAQMAARNAKKIAKSKKLETLDKAMTVADVAQVGYSIAQILMQKAKAGTTLTNEEFGKLTMSQQIDVDFQRWARGLERADFELFKQRGGDKTAAMQLARLMDAGADPDDWIGNEVNAVIEAAGEELEDLIEYNAAEDDECDDELDKDDRSDAEKIGLLTLSLIDQGIGEAISEGLLEKRNKARFNDCVRRKTAENDSKIAKLKRSLGIDPKDPNFDIEDLDNNLAIQAHVLTGVAAKNPNVNLALELDASRSLLNMPPIDKEGRELNSPATITNNNIEKLAVWFIRNETSDVTQYPDQGFIQNEIRKDAFFVQRALARIPNFADFASAEQEVRDLKFELTSETKQLSPYQKNINDKIKAIPPTWNNGDEYYIGDVVLYNKRYYRCGRGKDFAEEYVDENGDTKVYTYDGKTVLGQEVKPGIKNPSWANLWRRDIFNGVWQDVNYVEPESNKKNLQKAQQLLDMFEDDETVKNAMEEVTRADERIEAQKAKDPWKPNTDYAPRSLVTYAGKVYSSEKQHNSGNVFDPEFWTELALYDDEELQALQNIGSATDYVDYLVYPVGIFVKYQNRIFKKIKHSGPEIVEEVEEVGEGGEDGAPASGIPPGAGIVPTNLEYWDEILLKDGDLIDLRSNPSRKWNPDKDYVTGEKMLYVDLQTYVARGNVGKNQPPTNEYGAINWKRLMTFDIDPALATQLIKEQRLATFASVITTADGYDPDENYPLHIIVYAFDGKYYKLIKEKKDKDGDLIPPPIPPNTTYWQVVSKGITVWDPKELYNVHDFVQYEGTNYLCIQNAPIGTLPTDENYWQLLDEQFDLLDADAIALNKENYEIAVMNRSQEFQDDVTASYEVDDIVTVFDDDGYPQFYQCIKDIPFGRASGDNLRKAKPFDIGERYPNGSVISFNGIIYEMINTAGNQGDSPDNRPEKWKVLGYENFPGPPNAEFWKDYSSIDAEEEKYDKLRKSSKVGTEGTTGIKAGDLVSDPATGSYYKLISKRPNDKEEYIMKDLPYFDNRKRTLGRKLDYLSWEDQNIPSEAEAKIATIELRAKWKNNKRYVKNDIVIDKYGFKYLCVKDTPYAPMEPYFNTPEYFITLSDDDWEDYILEIKQGIENTVEGAQANEAIRFKEDDMNKPRTWGEIVFHDNKFYKFFAVGQTESTYKPTRANQEIPGKLPKESHPPLEWYPCDSNGNLLIVEEKDYTINLKEPYIYIYTEENKGPIISTDNTYLIYNDFRKDIFGLGEGQFADRGDIQSWGALGDKDHRPDPQDTYTTEVFKDGKPKYKHDDTGAIIGTNIDTSSLPPSEATAITDIVDEQDCPTAQDDGNDSPTHHEITQAERDLEKATIEAKVKGEEAPALIQGQNTITPVGTASGYNIEELDGSKYHQKKKRVYKKKNKNVVM